MTGFYRRISAEESVELEQAGEHVEWAEGVGYIVYDERARIEGQEMMERIKGDRLIDNEHLSSWSDIQTS